MSKIWENINGKCHCFGRLTSNRGCDGGNCRRCCYNMAEEALNDLSPMLPLEPSTDTGPQASKKWENINGQCYCNGSLVSNRGCDGANCRRCCYNLGRAMDDNTRTMLSEYGSASNTNYDPSPQLRKWQNVNGKCYCNGHLVSNRGCDGGNCRKCCYNMGFVDTSELTRY
jgi:hypothetical protein